MSYVYALWVQGKDLHQRVEELKEIPVMDLAYRQVIAVDINQPLQDVCEILSDHQVKKVPVLENGKVVGVIARTSLMRAMVAVASGRMAEGDGATAVAKAG